MITIACELGYRWGRKRLETILMHTRVVQMKLGSHRVLFVVALGSFKYTTCSTAWDKCPGQMLSLALFPFC